MQPLVLTLPDSIRARLEAALDVNAEPEGDTLVRGYEKIVRDVLLNEHPAPEDRAFLRHFQESMLGLQLGSASPAIMLRNLPQRGETGKHFVLGLNDMLGEGGRHEQPLSTTGAQPMHKDGHYSPDHPSKRLAMIYCEQAGYPPVPTVMASADDVIDHWAGLLVAKGRYPEDMLEKAKEDLTARLRAVSVPVPRSDGPPQELPLLVDNPNYQPDSGAPRTMFSIDPGHIRKYIPNGHGLLLEREVTTALNGLRNKLSPESDISTESHTLVVYNDPLVMHARGLKREVSESETGEHLPSGRLVRAYDMFGSVAMQPDAEYTPQVNATGGPASYVTLTQRDGSTVIDTRQR